VPLRLKITSHAQKVFVNENLILNIFSHLKCINVHEFFISMVASYEEIFSTVIMLRGLLNVFALSSIALEIVVKVGSRLKIFEVMSLNFQVLLQNFEAMDQILRL